MLAPFRQRAEMFAGAFTNNLVAAGVRSDSTICSTRVSDLVDNPEVVRLAHLGPGTGENEFIGIVGGLHC
jgi:hypothetical protein